MKLLSDRVHRIPRIWSNRELETFAGLFSGDVVNVSGWKDVDKEGRRYRDYFVNAKSYTITNFVAEARGFQGMEGEVFLDLEGKLPDELSAAFDCVFNHTTLEHIFEFQMAFHNICKMSRDVVVIVLPFLQQCHSDYGDYWRFSPSAIKKLFEREGMEVVYQSFNKDPMSSVYVFTIASKLPQRWNSKISWTYSDVDPTARGAEPYCGYHAIPRFGSRIGSLIRRFWGGARASRD